MQMILLVLLVPRQLQVLLHTLASPCQMSHTMDNK